ncbi:MAG TPA: HlyD family efflux transporter periplasmic adaptor subunit [Saprospiraceae bacterium]|nr:HlyD family efflux transporter periplasmic adaptor subunit [Saprospiraceae bacterium]
MENNNLRSEEVQEVLGTPPSWIVRYGTVLALVFLTLFVAASANYQYPDIVENRIIITFSEPPRTLVAPKSGRVADILVQNNEYVEKGQLLIVFEDAGDFYHITYLQDLMSEIPNENDSIIVNFSPNMKLDLGEIEEDYLNFLEKKNKYSRENEQSEVKRSVNSYSAQIRALQKSIQFLTNRKEIIIRQINDALKRENELKRKVQEREASQAEVNVVSTEIRSLRVELQETEENISRKKYDVQALRSRISVTKMDGNNTRLNSADELISSFIQLKVRVDQWVENNIVYSPVEGKVEFNELLSKQQFMRKDEALMVVIPAQSQFMKGKMKVPLKESGFVKPTQEVIIRLDKFPFKVYGALTGRVTYKATVPNSDDQILVEILLTSFETTRGQTIEANEVLVGDARIITEKRTLLLRIFDSIRGFFS